MIICHGVMTIRVFVGLNLTVKRDVRDFIKCLNNECKAIDPEWRPIGGYGFRWSWLDANRFAYYTLVRDCCIELRHAGVPIENYVKVAVSRCSSAIFMKGSTRIPFLQIITGAKNPERRRAWMRDAANLVDAKSQPTRVENDLELISRMMNRGYDAYQARREVLFRLSRRFIRNDPIINELYQENMLSSVERAYVERILQNELHK